MIPSFTRSVQAVQSTAARRLRLSFMGVPFLACGRLDFVNSQVACRADGEVVVGCPGEEHNAVAADFQCPDLLGDEAEVVGAACRARRAEDVAADGDAGDYCGDPGVAGADRGIVA